MLLPGTNKFSFLRLSSDWLFIINKEHTVIRRIFDKIQPINSNNKVNLTSIVFESTRSCQTDKLESEQLGKEPKKHNDFKSVLECKNNDEPGHYLVGNCNIKKRNHLRNDEIDGLHYLLKSQVQYPTLFRIARPFMVSPPLSADSKKQVPHGGGVVNPNHNHRSEPVFAYITFLKLFIASFSIEAFIKLVDG